MARGGCRLGEPRKQQIGADGEGGARPTCEMRNGVISEPAPTPVKPDQEADEEAARDDRRPQM